MSEYTLIAYDLTDKDDKNRKMIRDKVEEYCGDSCPLSESCYMFQTDDSVEKIFSELGSVLDDVGDRLSVIKINDIMSNLWCGEKARIRLFLDHLAGR